ASQRRPHISIESRRCLISPFRLHIHPVKEPKRVHGQAESRGYNLCRENQIERALEVENACHFIRVTRERETISRQNFESQPDHEVVEDLVERCKRNKSRAQEQHVSNQRGKLAKMIHVGFEARSPVDEAEVSEPGYRFRIEVSKDRGIRQL